MTVEKLAIEMGLWEMIRAGINAHAKSQTVRLLEQVAALPVRSSSATCRLGSYVTRRGKPVCIRLQFAQEPASLKQTFLHEVAHACDHLCGESGTQSRRGHGPRWRAWARAFGTSEARCGESPAMASLYRQRLKRVAVCEKCGLEFFRLRRLNRRQEYRHNSCGGRLKKL